MNDFCIVLVRPRDPNNIGACARAMANFGLSDLRVVHPFSEVWRETVSAVGADDIMQQARLFDTLGEALSDTHFSLAATALRNRDLVQEVIFLPHLNSRLQTVPRGRVALVFGNEKSGLSNEDIEHCDAILNIPTTSKQPSINLAQAVTLTCYELSKRADFVPLKILPAENEMPTEAQKEIFIEVIDQLFEAADYRTDLTSDQRKNQLRHILTRQGMTRWQLFFVKSLAERILQKIR